MSIIKQDYGELSSGGEHYEETLLWENPNPTSNFAQQAVTLSDDINNYDYISVEYKSSKPATIASKVIIPVNDFKAYSGTTASASDGNKGFRWFIGSRYQDGSNTYGYVRYVSYTSDTSITITNGYALGTTTTSVQTVVIPYKIYGVKKVGGLSETILWENTNLGATSFPNQNITLSNGNFADYEYIRLICKEKAGTTSTIKEIEVTMPVSQFEDTYTIGTNNKAGMAAVLWGSDVFVRAMLKGSADNIAVFTHCYNTTQSTSDDWIIPYQIIGLK